MKRKLFILLASLFVFASCSFVEEKPKNVESFYFYAGGFDYSRIPLIKPFELRKLKGEEEWHINASSVPCEKVKNNSYNSYGDFGPIDSIYCKDSIIYGHKAFYQDKAFGEYDTPEWWFVVNMVDSNIYLYENRVDFIKSLKSQEDIPFMLPDSLHEIFDRDYILPWFSDSIKAELQKHAEKQKKNKSIFDFLKKPPFVSRN